MRNFKSFFVLACLFCLVFGAVPAFAEYPAIMRDLDPHGRVVSYEVEEGVLSVSEEFTLKLNVENSNPYTDACNILVNYYFPGDQGFATVLGDTNQFYIERIRAGETVPVRIRLQANDAYSGSVVIISFEYKYSNTDGEPFINVTHIAPHLVPKCEMRIDGITIADRTVDGQKAMLSVRYSNTGKAALSNIVMHIEGDVPEDERDIELPPVEIGKQSMLDCYVTLLQPGEQKLDIFFTYEDPEGRPFTIDPQQYTAKLSPSLQPQGNQLANGKGWIYLGFSCVTLFLVLALILFIVKKKGR